MNIFSEMLNSAFQMAINSNDNFWRVSQRSQNGNQDAKNDLAKTILPSEMGEILEKETRHQGELQYLTHLR